jgi:SAM-dependent methyltransferase
MKSKLKSRLSKAYYYCFHSNSGYCPICEKKVRFLKRSSWLRDNYRCSSCNSIPRFRAVIDTIKQFCEGWQDMVVHESSPNRMASSNFLKSRCKNYSSSQYFEDVPRGQYRDGHRSEDLTALTLESNSIDLLVTQDVFEHVLEPEKAFKEIARVLKPGGAHVFSMPWYPELRTTRPRAKLADGKLVHLEPEVYHGNPVNKSKGSLVTTDWGLDFMDIIFKNSGLVTTVYLQRDPSKGLDGKFLEIFISRKNGN